jgi:hypothetical protein
VATVAQQALGKAALDNEVYLPEMADELIARLRPIESTLVDIAQRERSAYLAYWKEQVRDGEQPIVADIGYEGSIQARLSSVTNEPLGGAYFAVTRKIDEVLTDDQWAVARFHDDRRGVAASPVLQHHLLLESLLTSPSGQFSHFEQCGTELVPRYRDDEEHSRRWELINKVQFGAEQFVTDMLDVVGEHMLDIETSPVSVQEPLHCAATGRWQLGAWSEALTVDDGYTGRGQVMTRPSAP